MGRHEIGKTSGPVCIRRVMAVRQPNPAWHWCPLKDNLNSQELCEQHDGAIKPCRSSCCAQHLVKCFSNCPISSNPDEYSPSSAFYIHKS